MAEMNSLVSIPDQERSASEWESDTKWLRTPPGEALNDRWPFAHAAHCHESAEAFRRKHAWPPILCREKAVARRAPSLKNLAFTGSKSGFAAGAALLVALLLSLLTGGALFAQLERLMEQVEAGNFKAVDFDNFDEFF